MTSKCTSAWPGLTPKWVSWICKLIPLFPLYTLHPLYHNGIVLLAGSRNMSVSAIIISPITSKPKSRGRGLPSTLMTPKCVRLQSCTMPTCTIFCLTCVGLMALYNRIRSMAHRSIFSLLKIPANHGYARQLLSWGIFCSWSLIRWYVLSWSSTMRCRFGTLPLRGCWTNCLMPKSICK